MAGELRGLINRCLQGDQAAMVNLVRRFQGQVFGLCYRMLGQRQDAEDAAQETFLRVIKSLHHWDQERDFEPWLLAIAGNRCRTALERRRHRPATQPMVEIPCLRSLGGRSGRDLVEEVNLALGQIRPEYREAFVLFHQHEFSYDQISAAMSRPLGTVKTWIHRARRELIHLLCERDILEEPRHALH